MTRQILWTGGFDSTYLVVDALLAGDHVRAITWRGWGMNDESWQKLQNEDEARRRIVAALPIELRRRLISRLEADPHAAAYAPAGRS